ncbi:unnamed protein product [Adineta ricciae]|uniref:Poly [ADP-ribose] polymerase n=1 Tax=Adineta ricciae TaxID=249248 RepID=A0A814BF19_ADIRI|nr:unnamed protein product [Adineta ricciae]CAF1613816.1 unnamed protein product [Adineta ricciae]
MSQSSSRVDVTTNNEDSERSCPSSKRRCQSPNSRRSLSNPSSCVFADLTPDEIDENKEQCHHCGKQEKLLKTFHCPSTHCFCLNCIFIWTQKHVQTKTPPRCLIVDCAYSLKVEDLDDLPIAIKDHQVLLKLLELKPPTENKDSRMKCGKCELYIDQHNFYIHQNECLGRSLTIPCEICYCPVSIDDYEQHMIICNNDNNTALIQFLVKHLQNPNIDEKNVKSFINAWQRKHRQTIDVYEMIEQFNQPIVLSNDLCDVCKNTVPSEDFYTINCDNGHSLCLGCYTQHLQRKLNTNQILTCYKCSYHLQDRDFLEVRALTNEQINLYQNYQNQKVIELYTQLYGNEDAVNVDPTLEQQNETATTATATNEDDIPRRKCEICSKQHSYGNIFVLHCNCKICYDCFANEVNRQRTMTNELLTCTLCRASIKRNDLANLRLPQVEIDAIQLYQQGKLFELEHAVHFSQQRSTNQADNNTNDNDDDSDFDILLINQQQCLPKYWTLPMLMNFSRHTLDPQSTEYKFVLDKFTNSWTHLANQQAALAPMTLTHNPAIPAHQLPPSYSSAPLMLPLTNQQPAIRQRQLTQPFRPIAPVSSNPNSTAVVNPMALPSMMTVPVAGNQISPQAPYFGHPWPQSMFQPSTAPSVPQTHFHAQAQPSSIPNIPQAHFPAQVHPSIPVPYTQTNVYNQRPLVHARRQMSRPSLPGTNPPTIIQIERIQNQRWFKQYSAHDFEFRQKLGKQTEQWLFHGCDEQASRNIEMECFNRSYAGQRAVAYGQGSYFARDSTYSHSYAAPDRNGIRRMFLARVLVGNTVQGNSSMRVPPAGFDTTGDGHSIFVTYHDSQAYAEYLISYR